GPPGGALRAHSRARVAVALRAARDGQPLFRRRGPLRGGVRGGGRGFRRPADDAFRALALRRVDSLSAGGAAPGLPRPVAALRPDAGLDPRAPAVRRRLRRTAWTLAAVMFVLAAGS